MLSAARLPGGRSDDLKQLMPRMQSIELGSRFVKRELPNVVWTVEKVFQIAAEPAHARLYKETQPRDKMTVSIQTLTNPRFFRRAS